VWSVDREELALMNDRCRTRHPTVRQRARREDGPVAHGAGSFLINVDTRETSQGFKSWEHQGGPDIRARLDTSKARRLFKAKRPNRETA
jgi:hypothetical protein